MSVRSEGRRTDRQVDAKVSKEQERERHFHLSLFYMGTNAVSTSVSFSFFCLGFANVAGYQLTPSMETQERESTAAGGEKGKENKRKKIMRKQRHNSTPTHAPTTGEHTHKSNTTERLKNIAR